MEITQVLYNKAVARFSPIETITFMFKNKSWMLDCCCGRDGVPRQINEYLSIDLVEPIVRSQARERGCGSWQHFPNIDTIPPDRDLKLLKRITKEEARLDLDVEVYDILGDDMHYHCGVKEIQGNEHIKIILEEAWKHED